MTEQTTGTTVQSAGDAATQTAATSGTAGGNAETEAERLRKLEAEKQQWLAEKSNYEQTKQERDALRQQVETMTSQPPTTGVDPVMADVQAYYNELLYLAQQGDRDARFQLAMIAGQQQAIAKAQREAAIAVLPSEIKSDVESLLQKNPNLDVPTARQIVEGQQAAKKVRDYEAREAEARRLAEEQGRTSGVTSVRPAPASETRTGTIKASELNARYAALNQRIKDGDRGAKAEAQKLGREIDTGVLKVILNE